MNRPLALLFAVIGVILLSSISLSLASRNGWLILLSTAAAIGFIGFGFVVKARLTRKRNRP